MEGMKEKGSRREIQVNMREEGRKKGREEKRESKHENYRTCLLVR
jgi:hypothetical protein